MRGRPDRHPFGGFRPVRWIGRQSFAGRFLTRRGADDSSGMPVRDLRVSPDHALLIDDPLVLARDIVNDVSIVQGAEPDRIDYLHLDLCARLRARGPHLDRASRRGNPPLT